jgi:hypothetical protein
MHGEIPVRSASSVEDHRRDTVIYTRSQTIDLDILRAIYYAVKHSAKALNMSLDYPTYSPELANANKYADSNRAI